MTPDVPVRASAASTTVPGAALDLADVAADAERDPTLSAALVDLRSVLGDDLTSAEPRPLEAPPEPTRSEGAP
ncbi:MAG: hypothetical protein P1P87_05250 [Trueperaceae bacterium]|nr:hypothetical protein [Trueperaceae bacterium]